MLMSFPIQCSSYKTTIISNLLSTIPRLSKSKPKRSNQYTKRDTNRSSAATSRGTGSGRSTGGGTRGGAAGDGNESSGRGLGTGTRTARGRRSLGDRTTKDTTGGSHVAGSGLGGRLELVKVVVALGVDGADHAVLAVLALGAVVPEGGGGVYGDAEDVFLLCMYY